MTGDVSPGQVADRQAGAAMAPERRGAGRRRRWRWLAAVVMAVAIGAVVAGVAGAFGGPSHPDAGSSDRTSTATVTRRSLSSQTQVAATLGDGGSYSVVNQASGTITALPAVGEIVALGQVLYRVSGSPVVLLYGQVPAYRGLSEGMTGPDVTELNADLVKLGYAAPALLGPRSGWDYFGSETAAAMEQLQSHLDVTVTGSLALGQAVFLTGPARITALGTAVVLGGAATLGSTVLTASSITPVVTIALDAAQQTEVKAGDHVTVTLPDGSATPAVVSSVGTVATSSSSGSSGPPTITVEVTLADPAAAGHLDQAPVTVSITTGSVSSALVVPVDALLAQPGAGYAVEEVTGAGRHHLVPVSVGLFDDAAGLVQVSGSPLAAGQRVVVPAI
jgi:Putative peptidoglycan binding domain